MNRIWIEFLRESYEEHNEFDRNLKKQCTYNTTLRCQYVLHISVCVGGWLVMVARACACAPVALFGMQRALHVRPLSLHHIFRHSHKGTFFGKKVQKIKCAF